MVWMRDGWAGSAAGLALACAAATGACTDSQAARDDGGQPPGEVMPDGFFEQYAEVQGQASAMSPDDLLATYATPEYVTGLSYDPLGAVGLDAIEQAIPLGAAAKDVLHQTGFVAVDAATAPTFEWAYSTIYDADLPVFVTSDSILYALHRSFDAILMQLEIAALMPELDEMLTRMHERLASGVPGNLEHAVRDVDVYLTVARSLLGGSAVPTVAGGDADALVERILGEVAAEAPGQLELFGTRVDYDFSQFRPRGHYEDDVSLQQYFRAMMWLGRTDLHLMDYEDGKSTLVRRGVEGALVLDHLLHASESDVRFATIDKALRTMIGEPDSMGPLDMPAFRAAVGITDVSELAGVSDAELHEVLYTSTFGLQRIMSQIMYTDPTAPPLVLPRVYLLLGQRFTLDSYVYNNVTFDRVQDLRTGEKVPRMLPDELDVQFVLGNNHAAKLLAPELNQYGYQGILHELRFLADAHPEEFWQESFYNGWLAGIRALNASDAEWQSYPEPMRTEAWQHKTLNAQAASRAELRHDTLLYVKQSYSGGIGCEYVDGYVEPVVDFYAQMQVVGNLGADLIDVLEGVGYPVPGATEYFANWTTTMQMLESIARQELAGQPLEGPQIEFLGQVVEQELVGCGEVAFDGWYPALFFDQEGVGEPKPTIADVHTAPTDEVGNEVGWVLHAATGFPNMLVMTVPGCEGAQASAYVGPISSFNAVLTENYDRQTDSRWAEDAPSSPARPPWAQAFVR